MNCRPIIGNDDGITFLGNTSETVVDEKLVREQSARASSGRHTTIASACSCKFVDPEGTREVVRGKPTI
jgi:hypothetical protein